MRTIQMNSTSFMKAYTKHVLAYNKQSGSPESLESFIKLNNILVLNHGEEEAEEIIGVLTELTSGKIDMAKNMGRLFGLIEAEKTLQEYSREAEQQ